MSGKLSRASLNGFLNYGLVAAAFLIVQAMRAGGHVSNSLNGQLVPICAYICMAVSLNLTVGVLGELSLGHAGFMGVGAFSGVVAAVSLTNVIPSAGLRLLAAILAGGIRESPVFWSVFRFCACAGIIWPSSPLRSVKLSKTSSTASMWGSTRTACTSA